MPHRETLDPKALPDDILARVTVVPPAPAAQIVAAVRTYGGCRVPGLLGPDMLRQLAEEADRAFTIDDPDVKQGFDDDDKRLAMLNPSERIRALFPAVTAFFSNPILREAATAYYGEPVELNTQIYIANNFGAPERLTGSSYDVHFDVNQCLKFFFYLSHVTQACGPFEFVPGSHLRNIETRIGLLREHGKPPGGAGYIGPSAEGLVSMTGPPGTLIVFDTDISHRTGHVRPGHTRRIIRGHTFSTTHWKLLTGETTFDDVGLEVLHRHQG